MSSKSDDIIEEKVEEERNGGRTEIRKYQLYKNTNEELKKVWLTLNQIIKVQRIRIIENVESKETSYYITNKTCQLEELSKGIRNHWLIENSLHWIKDVIFEEDKTRHKENSITENKSILINMVINILRNNQNKYLKRTMRLYCNDIPKLMSFIE